MKHRGINQKYPKHTVILPMGKEFSYRYYRNPDAKSTVLLLSGGIGLSDLFYLHLIDLRNIFPY